METVIRDAEMVIEVPWAFVDRPDLALASGDPLLFSVDIVALCTAGVLSSDVAACVGTPTAILEIRLPECDESAEDSASILEELRRIFAPVEETQGGTFASHESQAESAVAGSNLTELAPLTAIRIAPSPEAKILETEQPEPALIEASRVSTSYLNSSETVGKSVSAAVSIHVTSAAASDPPRAVRLERSPSPVVRSAADLLEPGTVTPPPSQHLEADSDAASLTKVFRAGAPCSSGDTAETKPGFGQPRRLFLNDLFVARQRSPSAELEASTKDIDPKSAVLSGIAFLQEEATVILDKEVHDEGEMEERERGEQEEEEEGEREVEDASLDMRHVTSEYRDVEYAASIGKAADEERQREERQSEKARRDDDDGETPELNVLDVSSEDRAVQHALSSEKGSAHDDAETAIPKDEQQGERAEYGKENKPGFDACDASRESDGTVLRGQSVELGKVKAVVGAQAQVEGEIEHDDHEEEGAEENEQKEKTEMNEINEENEKSERNEKNEEEEVKEQEGEQQGEKEDDEHGSDKKVEEVTEDKGEVDGGEGNSGACGAIFEHCDIECGASRGKPAAENVAAEEETENERRVKNLEEEMVQEKEINGQEVRHALMQMQKEVQMQEEEEVAEVEEDEGGAQEQELQGPSQHGGAGNICSKLTLRETEWDGRQDETNQVSGTVFSTGGDVYRRDQSESMCDTASCDDQMQTSEVIAQPCGAVSSSLSRDDVMADSEREVEHFQLALCQSTQTPAGPDILKALAREDVRETEEADDYVSLQRRSEAEAMDVNANLSTRVTSPTRDAEESIVTETQAANAEQSCAHLGIVESPKHLQQAGSQVAMSKSSCDHGADEHSKEENSRREMLQTDECHERSRDVSAFPTVVIHDVTGIELRQDVGAPVDGCFVEPRSVVDHSRSDSSRESEDGQEQSRHLVSKAKAAADNALPAVDKRQNGGTSPTKSVAPSEHVMTVVSASSGVATLVEGGICDFGRNSTQLVNNNARIVSEKDEAEETPGERQPASLAAPAEAAAGVELFGKVRQAAQTTSLDRVSSSEPITDAPSQKSERRNPTTHKGTAEMLTTPEMLAHVAFRADPSLAAGDDCNTAKLGHRTSERHLQSASSADASHHSRSCENLPSGATLSQHEVHVTTSACCGDEIAGGTNGETAIRSHLALSPADAMMASFSSRTGVDVPCQNIPSCATVQNEVASLPPCDGAHQVPRSPLPDESNRDDVAERNLSCSCAAASTRADPSPDNKAVDGVAESVDGDTLARREEHSYDQESSHDGRSRTDLTRVSENSHDTSTDNVKRAATVTHALQDVVSLVGGERVSGEHSWTGGVSISTAVVGKSEPLNKTSQLCCEVAGGVRRLRRSQNEVERSTSSGDHDRGNLVQCSLEFESVASGSPPPRRSVSPEARARLDASPQVEEMSPVDVIVGAKVDLLKASTDTSQHLDERVTAKTSQKSMEQCDGEGHFLTPKRFPEGGTCGLSDNNRRFSEIEQCRGTFNARFVSPNANGLESYHEDSRTCSTGPTRSHPGLLDDRVSHSAGNSPHAAAQLDSASEVDHEAAARLHRAWDMADGDHLSGHEACSNNASEADLNKSGTTELERRMSAVRGDVSGPKKGVADEPLSSHCIRSSELAVLQSEVANSLKDVSQEEAKASTGGSGPDGGGATPLARGSPEGGRDCDHSIVGRLSEEEEEEGEEPGQILHVDSDSPRNLALLSCKELSAACRARGLRATGRKHEMFGRLEKFAAKRRRRQVEVQLTDVEVQPGAKAAATPGKIQEEPSGIDSEVRLFDMDSRLARQERTIPVELEVLTHKALTEVCRKHGLPVFGRKVELITRLRDYEATESVALAGAESPHGDFDEQCSIQDRKPGLDQDCKPIGLGLDSLQSRTPESLPDPFGTQASQAIDLDAVPISELRDACRMLGLSTDGRKTDLQARLTMCADSLLATQPEGDSQAPPSQHLPEQPVLPRGMEHVDTETVAVSAALSPAKARSSSSHGARMTGALVYDLCMLSVKELRSACAEHGLPVYGRKTDLIDRLAELADALPAGVASSCTAASCKVERQDEKEQHESRLVDESAREEEQGGGKADIEGGVEEITEEKEFKMDSDWQEHTAEEECEQAEVGKDGVLSQRVDEQNDSSCLPALADVTVEGCCSKEDFNGVNDVTVSQSMHDDLPASLQDLSIDVLRAACNACGLSTNGGEKELTRRLVEHQMIQESADGTDNSIDNEGDLPRVIEEQQRVPELATSNSSFVPSSVAQPECGSYHGGPKSEFVATSSALVSAATSSVTQEHRRPSKSVNRFTETGDALPENAPNWQHGSRNYSHGSMSIPLTQPEPSSQGLDESAVADNFGLRGSAVMQHRSEKEIRTHESCAGFEKPGTFALKQSAEKTVNFGSEPAQKGTVADSTFYPPKGYARRRGVVSEASLPPPATAKGHLLAPQAESCEASAAFPEAQTAGDELSGAVRPLESNLAVGGVILGKVSCATSDGASRGAASGLMFLRTKELRRACLNRGLGDSGGKHDLVERLMMHFADCPPTPTPTQERGTPSPPTAVRKTDGRPCLTRGRVADLPSDNVPRPGAHHDQLQAAASSFLLSMQENAKNQEQDGGVDPEESAARCSESGRVHAVHAPFEVGFASSDVVEETGAVSDRATELRASVPCLATTRTTDRRCNGAVECAAQPIEEREAYQLPGGANQTLRDVGNEAVDGHDAKESRKELATEHEKVCSVVTTRSDVAAVTIQNPEKRIEASHASHGRLPRSRFWMPSECISSMITPGSAVGVPVSDRQDINCAASKQEPVPAPSAYHGMSLLKRPRLLGAAPISATHGLSELWRTMRTPSRPPSSAPSNGVSTAQGHVTSTFHFVTKEDQPNQPDETSLLRPPAPPLGTEGGILRSSFVTPVPPSCRRRDSVHKRHGQDASEPLYGGTGKQPNRSSSRKSSVGTCHGWTVAGAPCQSVGTVRPQGSRFAYCRKHADKWARFEPVGVEQVMLPAEASRCLATGGTVVSASRKRAAANASIEKPSTKRSCLKSPRANASLFSGKSFNEDAVRAKGPPPLDRQSREDSREKAFTHWSAAGVDQQVGERLRHCSTHRTGQQSLAVDGGQAVAPLRTHGSAVFRGGIAASDERGRKGSEWMVNKQTVSTASCGGRQSSGLAEALRWLPV
eukprot:TRINITY_DN20191_c0_g3_i1.p1 TRINITY_DN20191_c0_g3~~TRINITY_DN20191_c0_g3_i1.p1  ORF type:complete len:3178 (-),score=554.60 TRINITY_DN20191_c0_g3_i1:170-9658(-)